MTQESRKIFRETLTAWLNDRPRNTSAGEILRDMREAQFGHPGGNHGRLPCWVYRNGANPLEMWFAFYRNVTDDDLICKVMPSGQWVEPGKGATIQFNADKCMRPTNCGRVALYHDGVVTVRHKISRADLLDAMRKSAPDCEEALGRLGPYRGWPRRLGTVDDLEQLIDNMFVYAYYVEQAKRYLRGDNPLPKARI